MEAHVPFWFDGPATKWAEMSEGARVLYAVVHGEDESLTDLGYAYRAQLPAAVDIVYGVFLFAEHTGLADMALAFCKEEGWLLKQEEPALT